MLGPSVPSVILPDSRVTVSGLSTLPVAATASAPWLIQVCTRVFSALENGTPFSAPAETRLAYTEWLLSRLDASQLFIEEAQNARPKFV